MPSSLVPHASRAHRLACLALYKALLKQSSALSSSYDSNKNGSLCNLVRHRFRKDRNLVSPSQVANGLKAGHGLLDLLQACNDKSVAALSKLGSLIESLITQAEHKSAWRGTLAVIPSPISPQKFPKIAHLRAVATKATQTRYSESKPILERPLPLSEIGGGTRRIPNLVAAHGIPFLRYSKPQPISLGRIIRQHMYWNDKKWAQTVELERDMGLAGLEDGWDEIVQSQHGVVDEPPLDPEGCWTPGSIKHQVPSEPSWGHELSVAHDEIKSALRAKDLRHAEMGAQMWEIVKKEKALKREEKIERRAARRALRNVVGLDVKPKPSSTATGSVAVLELPRITDLTAASHV